MHNRLLPLFWQPRDFVIFLLSTSPKMKTDCKTKFEMSTNTLILLPKLLIGYYRQESSSLGTAQFDFNLIRVAMVQLQNSKFTKAKSLSINRKSYARPDESIWGCVREQYSIFSTLWMISTVCCYKDNLTTTAKGCFYSVSRWGCNFVR